MIDLDNICEYFIWWPDKDKDPNKQVCPNWAPNGRWMFDDEDDENNKIFIRLCPEHLTEIHRRSKPRPRPKPDKLKYYLHERLNKVYEITLSVKGRKSGRDISRPVWFVYEGNTLYLLPVQGSDTNWYKNLLVDPTLKISVNGVEISERGKPITDGNSVDDILRKFKSKYGERDVKRYYAKFDVAVEVLL